MGRYGLFGEETVGVCARYSFIYTNN